MMKSVSAHRHARPNRKTKQSLQELVHHRPPKVSFPDDDVGSRSIGTIKIDHCRKKILAIPLAQSSEDELIPFEAEPTKLNSCKIMKQATDTTPSLHDDLQSESDKSQQRASEGHVPLYHEWAASVVFSGLTHKTHKVEHQIVPPFIDWARDTVFRGVATLHKEKLLTHPPVKAGGDGAMNAITLAHCTGMEMKCAEMTPSATQKDGVCQSEKPEPECNTCIVFNGIESKENNLEGCVGYERINDMSVPRERKPSISVKVEELVNVSIQKENSMQFDVHKTIERKKSMVGRTTKFVAFRGRDSLIPNKSTFTKSIANLDVNESSVDLETLIGQGRSGDLPSLSEGAHKKDEMGQSIGDIDYIPPQCGDHERTGLCLPANPNFDLPGTSYRGFDVNYVSSSPAPHDQKVRSQCEEMKRMAKEHAGVANSEEQKRQEKPVQQKRRNLIRRHKEENDWGFNPEEDPNSVKDQINANQKECRIPEIVTASVTKQHLEERVGLVFAGRHRILLTKMMPNSPFRETNLAINDELLVINGHRIKSAKKAAEFIKSSQGALTITAFRGTRPRESEIERLLSHHFRARALDGGGLVRRQSPRALRPVHQPQPHGDGDECDEGDACDDDEGGSCDDGAALSAGDRISKLKGRIAQLEDELRRRRGELRSLLDERGDTAGVAPAMEGSGGDGTGSPALNEPASEFPLRRRSGP